MHGHYWMALDLEASEKTQELPLEGPWWFGLQDLTHGGHVTREGDDRICGVQGSIPDFPRGRISHDAGAVSGKHRVHWRSVEQATTADRPEQGEAARWAHPRNREAIGREEWIVAILEQPSRGRRARDSQEAVAVGRRGERQTVAEGLELVAVRYPAVALLEPKALLRQQ